MRPHLLLALLLIPALRAQDAPETENPEWEKLKTSAAKFVEAYNSKDPVALAALMTPDGEMVREDGSRISGREDIEEFYADAFEERPDATVSLEATSIRFLSPILAIEDGALYITEAADGEPATFLYTALHVRQEDGTWLMAQSRDREVANLEAFEALADVDGLVGDWISRTEAGSLKLSFTWDDGGSFLLGKAVYAAVGLEPVNATIRIGWDSVRERIVSWTFDSEGGFSKAEWTDADDRWVLRASGYTSDGEITSSTQILQPTSTDSFTWTITDKIIGAEIAEERSMKMVRLPPEPQVSGK